MKSCQGMPRRVVAFIFLFLACLPSYAVVDDKPGQLIRVGVFPNPPVAFKDQQGNWHGISVDVLKAVAQKRGWQLQFVENSFSGLLKDFEQDHIDIIALMAYSEKRAKKYTFSHVPLISNWGLIYKRPDSDITSLLDLQGKRVGVMKNNIHDKAFRRLIRQFGIDVEIVELANFRDVLQHVHDKKVDAGVANRLFGALNANKYNVVETGIIFNPINIHYASLQAANRGVLDAIDKALQQYKSDNDSVYFQAIQRWMNPHNKPFSYQWLLWAVAGLAGIIILMSGITYLLRRQIAKSTYELQQEIEERREAERKLDELAYYDSLTKLPNRVSLLDTLKVAISRARRRNTTLAVLFIDIDRFKNVNDSLGHAAGDQLIVNVAQRLQACLREDDSIHRFGGDEFVAILQDITDITYINHIASRMLQHFSEPVHIENTEVFSSICIGIAMFPDDDSDGEHLLKYADAAMYHAKAQGRNNFQFYNEKLTASVQQRLELETRLRHALERNEFVLHYQPVFDLHRNRPVGVEALIRWQDPDKGLIPPDQFIPLAEETGLILAIGDWVIEEACKQLQQWQQQGLGDLIMAINVSSLQFENDRLFDSVSRALQMTGVKPEQLELEITERMFLDINMHLMNTLDKINAAGVRMSIDDFGTGYSSLSYLKQLPINTLKIDRSFIMGIPQDKDDVQIASTVISMAHGLGMDVVAEGIETIQQLDYLTALDCRRGQGYYLCKPQPADVVSKWLLGFLNGDTVE